MTAQLTTHRQAGAPRTHYRWRVRRWSEGDSGTGAVPTPSLTTAGAPTSDTPQVANVGDGGTGAVHIPSCENTRVCRNGKDFLNVGGEGVNSVSSTHLSRSGKNLSRS